MRVVPPGSKIFAAKGIYVFLAAILYVMALFRIMSDLGYRTSLAPNPVQKTYACGVKGNK